MSETTQSSDLEQNKRIIRNFVQKVLNRHDIEAADKYFPEEDPIQFKQFLSRFFQRFPDSRTTIDHIIAENDMVMLMMTGTATDKQTDKLVTMKAADLYRIDKGRIAEHWDVVDRSEIQ
jgi:predicted SnoaL-like aldol condensation-catalyzing enzyme